MNNRPMDQQDFDEMGGDDEASSDNDHDDTNQTYVHASGHVTPLRS
jgi:hypothetical protein